MVERRAMPAKRERARALRREPATAEHALWQLLRRGRIGGVRFRRRAVVLGWIPDFWCPSAKLAIEIDARASAWKTERDRARDAHLARHGVRTLHLRADEILTNPEIIATRVETAVAEARPDLFP